MSFFVYSQRNYRRYNLYAGCLSSASFYRLLFFIFMKTENNTVTSNMQDQMETVEKSPCFSLGSMSEIFAEHITKSDEELLETVKILEDNNPQGQGENPIPTTLTTSRFPQLSFQEVDKIVENSTSENSKKQTKVHVTLFKSKFSFYISLLILCFQIYFFF